MAILALPIAGPLRVVARAPHDIWAFDAAFGSAIYDAIVDVKLDAVSTSYPVTFVDQFGFSNAEEPRRYVFRRFAVTRERGVQDLGEIAPDLNPGFWISPNGKYAVALKAIPMRDLPTNWQGYQQLPSQQFYLIDLLTGAQRPVVEAPVQWGVSARFLAPLWFPDSRRFIVVNTMLPLIEKAPERASTGYLVLADVNSRTWTAIAPLLHRETEQASVAWITPGSQFEVVTRVGSSADVDASIAHLLYTQCGERWTREEVASSKTSAMPPEEVIVDVREDMNSLPRLVVAAGDRIIATSDVSDARSRELALTRPITWSDRSGSAWHGGLTLPRAQPRRLIVQLGDFDPNQFQPDGSATTAFAAQSLATHGFAVLRLSIYARETSPTGSELVDSIDAAVAMLRSKYRLPSEPIGLIGFSYTGWLTTYVLSHPGKVRVGAAIDADGGDTSYVNYALFHVMSPGLAAVREDFETRNGGDFWSNRATWLDRTVGFNLHHIEAPLLVTSGGDRSGLLQFAELYAGLRMLKRPIELVLFPDGRHQLRLPRQRLASMDLSVDWMRFWLLGETDRDLTKANQYQRWESIRASTQGSAHERH